METREAIAERAKRRALDALRMRNEGLTYREIGERIGNAKNGDAICAERARALVCRGKRYNAVAEVKLRQGKRI